MEQRISACLLSQRAGFDPDSGPTYLVLVFIFLTCWYCANVKLDCDQSMSQLLISAQFESHILTISTRWIVSLLYTKLIQDTVRKLWIKYQRIELGPGPGSLITELWNINIRQFVSNAQTRGARLRMFETWILSYCLEFICIYCSLFTSIF